MAKEEGITLMMDAKLQQQVVDLNNNLQDLLKAINKLALDKKLNSLNIVLGDLVGALNNLNKPEKGESKSGPPRITNI